jgi:acetyl esterase/lipase
MPTRILLLLLFCCAPLRLACAQLPEQASTPGLVGLRARLETLEARVAKKEIPADAQNAPLLKFKIEQARLWLQSLDSNEPTSILSTPYEETKRYVETALNRAESIARARGDAVYPAISQLHERAYITNNDGSVQPYWIFVPQGFSPRQKWPLVVFLHGYSPGISKIQPWVPGPETWTQFTARGFVLAVPYGRRNSDFVNVGEDDTLAVTREVSTRYNADPERTFLLGPSMGGYGVYAVGLHNPDRFAAIAPMCARTDMYLWFGLDREALPAWRQVLYDADDPRRLARNAFQTPIFLQHGSNDLIVSVENSRRFFADARVLKIPAFYREISGGSHYIYFGDSVYAIALDWMKKLRRAPTPPRMQFSTGSLRNNRAYWVSIEGFQRYDRLAGIDAHAGKGNLIEVKTDNVTRFVLNAPREYITREKPVTLIVNGVEQTEKYDATQPINWPRATDEKLHKTPGRCGPIKECYRDPFLVVYGAASDEMSARRFVTEWDLFADGKPPIKADKEVTDADRKNYNLILFGTRETNSLLKETSDKLPLELMPGGYRIGEQEYSADDKKLGLQFCYPSPFDDKRMIVVQSGYYWGEALPINHKFDLLPEYIVYSDEIDATAQTDSTLQTNHAIAAGFFDDQWQLPEEKMEAVTEGAAP